MGLLSGCAAGSGSCQAPCTSAVVHLALVGGHLAVPMESQGKLVEVALDTGAFHTSVTEAAAAKLDARVVRDMGDPGKLDAQVSMSGVGGDTNAEILTVPDLLLAGVHIRDQQLIALPSLRFHDPRIEGLVGGDMLQNWDLDLDVGRGLLNLDLPQRNPPTPPWHGATTTVPFVAEHGTLIRIPVTLDGHPIEAEIDTGSPPNLVEAGTAAGREVAPDDRIAHARGIAGRLTDVRVHHFGDLSIGGLSFGPIDAAVGSGVVPDGDMIIGLDVLRMARIYVAYSAGVVLIDEGGS